MPGRITSPDDLGQLNRALQRIDKVEKNLQSSKAELFQVQKRVSTLDALHAPTPTTNNLVATWTGATGTISWPPASLQDKNAQALVNQPGSVHTVPVVSGAIHGLQPNTHYWLGWNKTQRQMTIGTDAHPILNQQDTVIICRLFTGTAIQSGVAGGGGSEAVRDLSGLTYKNF